MTLFRFLLFSIVLSWTALPSIAFGNDLNYPLQQKKMGCPSSQTDGWFPPQIPMTLKLAPKSWLKAERIHVARVWLTETDNIIVKK